MIIMSTCKQWSLNKSTRAKYSIARHNIIAVIKSHVIIAHMYSF